MSFVLGHGISFCETNGRFIFLDTREDRYSCLRADGEASFRRLIAGCTLSAGDRAVLAGLAVSGLLKPAPTGQPPNPCSRPAEPECSLLNENRRARPSVIVRALGRLMFAAAALKLAPLHWTLRRLKTRKRALVREREFRAEILSEVAAAFGRIALFAAPLDRCLPRSIALFETLIDMRLAPELVIGVRLQPFGAHCWVQRGSILVNESIDQVRNFTPILIV